MMLILKHKHLSDNFVLRQNRIQAFILIFKRKCFKELMMLMFMDINSCVQATLLGRRGQIIGVLQLGLQEHQKKKAVMEAEIAHRAGLLENWDNY